VQTLHPEKVISMGAFGMPEIYAEQKYAHDVALQNSLPVINEAWDELKEVTGREYQAVGHYKTEGADTLIVAMGSICETASLAVDMMREQGKKVGLVKLKLWRPFPLEDVRKALAGASDAVVLDRAISLGGVNCPVTSEIRAAMYHEAQRPKIHCTVAGLGGRDVSPKDVINMVELSLSETDKEYHVYGVRG
jgi:pyruvate ferredoxin oxidoreductase alpha subunit